MFKSSVTMFTVQETNGQGPLFPLQAGSLDGEVELAEVSAANGECLLNLFRRALEELGEAQDPRQ